MTQTTSSERWRLVKELLAPALEMEVCARKAYLEQVSDGDPSMRAELERHLAAHDQAGSDFLSEPAAIPGEGPSASVGVLSGLRVGAYLLVEQLGAGGMGEVYRAYRADDQYRKEVAVKLVRAGRESEAVIRRFRNERQILAGLDHPNIARLLDGGNTVNGAPYFVMELVAGLPVDEYCDRLRLTIPDRLRLFVQVCSAIQFAHQHLVVHRDIKPNNVLVTPDGIPKLLDFGIAKILDPASSEFQLEPTQSIFRALTPGYASPEQVIGGPITTSSDVYSLGVVLHELLAGRSPYRLTSRTPQEIARVICDIEPENPSSRSAHSSECGEDTELSTPTLAEIAAARQTSPDKLKKLLHGDLDNIILMALRKEPQRRYSSVEQLARDIERHLANLPVLARRDTFGYRTSKFLSRHKAGVAIAAAILCTILLAATVTLREAQIALQQAKIAQSQRARAERHFSDLRELSNSLMFDVHDAIRDLPGSTPARKILIDKSLKYLDRLALDAGNDASLKRELAVGYERVAAVQGYPFGPNLGDTRGATESFRKAAAIWDSLSRTNHDVENMLGLASNYRQLGGMLANGGGGDPFDAVKASVRIAEQMKGLTSSDSRIADELVLDYEMAAEVLARSGGDPESALEYLSKELAIAAARANTNPQDRGLQRRLVRIHILMGDSLADLGWRSEALDQSAQGLRILESGILDTEQIDTGLQRSIALSLSKRADILSMNGDFESALSNYRRSQIILARLAAADPRNTQAEVELAAACGHVGHVLAAMGRVGKAMVMFKRGSELVQSLVGNPLQTEAVADLARIYLWTGELHAGIGRASEALESYQKSTTRFAANLSILPWDRFTLLSVAEVHARAGAMLAKLNRPKEAATEYFHALDIVTPQAQARPKNPLAWYVLADTHVGLGELSEAAAQKSRNAIERHQDWIEARDHYQQAVLAWQRVPNRGVITPGGFTSGDPTQAANSLAHCEAQLARTAAN